MTVATLLGCREAYLLLQGRRGSKCDVEAALTAITVQQLALNVGDLLQACAWSPPSKKVGARPGRLVVVIGPPRALGARGGTLYSNPAGFATVLAYLNLHAVANLSGMPWHLFAVTLLPIICTAGCPVSSKGGRGV